MPVPKDESPNKVNIKHIAKVAGVSPSTVSRALRNDPKANQKTIDRIQKIAEQLNYFPDSLAKGLRQNKTNTIGIIFNDLNNPFYTEILSVIGEILHEQHYSMIISYSNYNSDREKQNIKTMLSKRVDGVILSPIDDKSENIKILRQNDVPFVLIDCFPYFKNTNYVFSKHGDGALLAVDHFIEMGHERILLLTGPPNRCMADHFIKQYKKSLKKHNIPVSDDLIFHGDNFSIESGYDAFTEILQSNIHFTGVITISDLMAIGIYKAANVLGFSIPGTYSIIGYDNIQITGMLSPPLTTVHQPRKRIGKESIEILLRAIANEEKEFKEVELKPYLIKRGSVRNLR